MEEARAFALVAAAIGLIACGGSFISLQVVHLVSGEIGRNPARALLATVGGAGAIVLGIEMIIMVMR